MKRLLALFLICALALSSAALAESADYTVAEKLVKQLAAGSGFSGVLTLEADTEAFSTNMPIVMDVDYIYVRPEDVSLGEHRVDATLMDGETALSQVHVQLLNGDLALQADVIGSDWYALALPAAEADGQQIAALSTALSMLSALKTTAGMDKAADQVLQKALEAFSTRLDIWMESYRQSAILDKSEDGTTTMQVDYAITPAAIKAEVKQLVFELLNDADLLAALRQALGEEMGAYLNPLYQQWYFESIDALPLSDDLTLTRVFSMKGDTLSLSLKLPLYDAGLGAMTLCYDRTGGSDDLPETNVLSMETENQLMELRYQAYSSMTGVQVVQGTVRREITADFTVADEAVQPFAVDFTLKSEVTESKDEDNRDVYTCNATLTLLPENGSETELVLSSRFVSEERKSAATEIAATLTASNADEAVEITLEGASRKKWEPAAVPAVQEPNWDSLLPGTALRTLNLLKDWIELPETTNE